MSNQRFIEISSSYRNRNQYPLPASFDVPFDTINLRQTEQLKGVYFNNKINSLTTNAYDTVTTGIVDYLWNGNSQYNGIVTRATPSSVSVGLLSPNVIDYFVGFTLNVQSASSTIISYDPSTCTFGLKEAIDIPPVGSAVTITDPSTNSAITLPGIDLIGTTILDYSQSYHTYYLINETKSLGTNIVYSKISSYNYFIRAATLTTPFAVWDVSDQYSLRKTLPNEFISAITLSLTGTVTSQLTTTLTVTNLNPLANYVGFQISIDGNTSTILQTSLSNTVLIISSNLPITTPTPFTIIPTFNKVDNYPQISLTNCIFLGPNANSADNYYTGKYIYVYPQNALVNIKGSCFYINSYVGNGYNACFVNLVDTPNVNAPTAYYPSYTNKEFDLGLIASRTINIVSFLKSNYTPLIYNGSIVSQTELVAYEIRLVSLVLPNILLTTGSNIAHYPYVYVEFSVNNSQTNIIYSNNPNSNKALFLVTIDNIKNQLTAPFIKLSGKSMTQTVKFRPNDCLKFSVFLPDGTLFQTLASDYYSPSGPNPFCQIDALFGIQRL